MPNYIIAYDISDNKRRKKVSDILEGYGTRVNYSVFEIQLSTKAQKKSIEKELLKILNPSKDSLRFYHICKNCIDKSWSLGEENPPFQRDTIYFF